MYQPTRRAPLGIPESRLIASFSLLSLVIGGHDLGSYRYGCEALPEQIDYFLRLLIATKQAGYHLQALKASLTAFDDIRRDVVQEQVLAPLIDKHPEVEFVVDHQRQHGRSYYQSAGFQVYIVDPSGKSYNLVEGGFTDWTQQLLSNRKERLLISGLGSERLVSCFWNS